MFELTDPIDTRSDLDWCWYLRRFGRVGEALERALHNIGVLQQDGWADWCPSEMTDTGAPVEMQFTANSDALSLWTEVDNPSIDPRTRMERAVAVMAELGAGPLPPALRDVIGTAQAAAPLGFGARLGLQQAESALDVTLYAELPAEAADLAGLFHRAQTTLPQGDVALPYMLGYHMRKMELSLYFRSQRPVTEMVPLLAAIGEVSAAPLQSQIERITLAGGPDANLGAFEFSLSFASASLPPLLTLYLPAKPIFGTDAAVTAQVHGYPGAPLPAYDALMEQHVPAPPGLIHHGKIGLLARADTYPILSIGVAAPWHCPLAFV